MSTDNKTDTRPAWMLDPTLDTVDDAAILAVGQALEDQYSSPVVDAFIHRGTDATIDTPSDGGGNASVAASSTPPVDAPSAGVLPSPELPAGEGDGPSDVEPAATFAVTVPGSTPIELSQEQALALIQQHNWLNDRPQEMLQAWGGIEQGTHQAVDLSEYAAFQAWQKSGAPAQQQTQRPIDLRDVDPDVAEYIQRLEATKEVVRELPLVSYDAAPTPAQIMHQQQQEVNRQVALRTALEATRAHVGRTYGLDVGQIDALAQAVGQANIIPAISQKYRQLSPLGNSVLSEGDPNLILSEAFETVMATHPQFREIRDETIFNARLAKTQGMNTVVNNKKAAASSLAHIPSAAVPNTGTKAIAEMSSQERHSAMVAEIAQLISSGEAVN